MMTTKAGYPIRGAAHDGYFSALNALLKEQGPGHPVMVLDLDILDQNIRILKQNIPPPKSFRVVVKSLPCVELLRHVFDTAGTSRAMVFHRPFLNRIAHEFPNVEILLGKPFPARAARIFYRELGEGAPFDPSTHLQWLIDTQDRLLQYQHLAAELGTRMRINIELDVGLHRGGVSDPQQLGPLLQTIAADPDHLVFSGFMGYDPHISRSEKLFIPLEKAFDRVLMRYTEFIAFLKSEFPGLYSERLTFNGAGSPTYVHYRDVDLPNDISVGSALVKPINFDLKALADHQPAMFIATPVLKKNPGVVIPFIEFAAPLMKKLKRGWGTTLFIYGGYWKAVPHSPKGLTYNTIYGRSTNQEMLNAPAGIDLDVDDYIFLRPTQSESVMLQFGDLIVLRGGAIVDRWPVFSQGAPSGFE
jgi:D-serine deaminase-like pyridoxal phosphate-dependent protein